MDFEDLIAKFGLTVLVNTDEITGDQVLLFKSQDGLFGYRKTLSFSTRAMYFGNGLEQAITDEVAPIFEEYEAKKKGRAYGVRYRMHINRERHHLLSKAPEDVNLIDVLEYIADGVMAGLARSGEVNDMSLPDELLQKAYKNTVELLKQQVVVEEET